MRFIAIGDNCIDNYEKERKKYPGGNAVNFAVYEKQLGNESAYFGVVGNDENGRSILDSLASKGVEVGRVRMEKGPTAVTEVELSEGHRILGCYEEGVLKNFSIRSEELDYIKSFDLVHTANWGKCEPYLSELKQSCILSYDFADKYDLEKIQTVSKDIDYGFISYEKEDGFIKDILRTICEREVRAAIATLGEMGSIAYDGVRLYSQGIIPVPVVDTMGAGDSFIAGFMDAVSKGAEIPEALHAGTLKATETIQYFGAW